MHGSGARLSQDERLPSEGMELPPALQSGLANARTSVQRCHAAESQPEAIRGMLGSVEWLLTVVEIAVQHFVLGQAQ